MIYAPAEDSYLLEKEVKKYAKGKNILDIGCGEGIQAEAALNSGAKKVVAVDISEKAVEFVKRKGIDAKKSNLFSSIKEKFDLIIFNPPYLARDAREDSESALPTTGGARGDETILRFLKKAPRFLSWNGIILLVVSSLTPRKRIEKILKENKMKRRIIASEKIFFEMLEVWEIYISREQTIS